jgi:methionyl-tRNA formyltransferase
MGSKDLGLALLRQMCETVNDPDQLVCAICPDDSSDERTVQESFRTVSAAQRLPLEIVSTTSQTETALLKFRPDLVIVSGWYQLIPLEKFPEIRFFGFHASPLPRYRGNAPLVWQIIQGESSVGLSLFQFASGIDSGDIVAQARLPLAQNETIADALVHVAACAIEQLRDHLPLMLTGKAILRRQDHTQATYCGTRVSEDGLINWTWPAKRVHNFVRAQTKPYPGAFTRLPDGQRVRIWRAEIDPRAYIGVPGGIAERGEDGIVVSCGEGAVRLLMADIDGNTSMPLRSIFKSLRVRLS